jgi:short-subunit dehydrogenase
LTGKTSKMKDKVVIITGASSGIGLACAREFAHRGALVSVCARSADKLEEIKSEFDAAGHKLLVTEADVSREEDCKRLIDNTVREFGKIDILINNAGMSMRALFVDLHLDVMRKLMDINFWGTVYCTKYALPYILEQKGSVVGVSSIAGFIGLPGRAGYSASKYAMHGFLNTLRVENLRKGLHVLIVAPGFTASNIRKTALTADGSAQGETPRNENKMMSAEEVALRIIKAIQKRKRTLILTFVEGKLTVFLSKWLPALVDKLSYNVMAKEPDSPFK